jgi:RNA polymerase sigma-70 factor (ECF subfamily)
MSEPSDRDLVKRTRRGDVGAYGELVRRYQQAVFAVCYRLMGERQDAEDMAQEAFIRAHERLATYDDARPFAPWVRRVAANICLNALKSRKVNFAVNEERDSAPDTPASSPEKAQARRERIEDVQQAIQELPPHYRAVIELRHFQELSYAEIAQTLEIPLSDVKSHLFRARKQLAERLESYAKTL